jgi:hypothetical protein
MEGVFVRHSKLTFFKLLSKWFFLEPHKKHELSLQEQSRISYVEPGGTLGNN